MRVHKCAPAVMMLYVPAVELPHQAAAHDQSLVLGATMPTLAAKEPLIPAAAGFNIVDTDEWLSKHLVTVA